MEVTADAKEKAKRQIEFYFSDSNLPRDVFMADQIAADPEGFVDISLLCTFKRMRDLLGIKEADTTKEKMPQSLLSAIAGSLEASEALTLSDDKARVRRTKPLTSAEHAMAQIDQRSLYASPFPHDTSLDGIAGFFQQRAPVNCVRMRRHAESKDFRGSVFVEFADEEAAQKVLKEQLEYEGAPMHLEPKLDFMARKKLERQEKGKAKAGAAGGDGQAAASSAADIAAAHTAANGAEPDAEAQPEAEEAFQEGMLLGFDFAPAEHDLYYSNIKDALAGDNPRNIRFVEFQRGASTGVVRYQSADMLQKALQLADGDGKLQIAGFTATIKKLEGEEEKGFYERAAAHKKAAQEAGGGRGGGRGGQKRNFRGGGRGGRQKRGRY